MTTTVILKPEISANNNGLIKSASRMIKGLFWLTPTESLTRTRSGDFGRSIETSLNHLIKEQGVIRLQLRKRDAAVVMSIDHYEEMIQMKKLYAELIEHAKDKNIKEATDQYDALYQSVTSAESRNAADSLFSANPKDLSRSYQPGRTETK